MANIIEHILDNTLDKNWYEEYATLSVPYFGLINAFRKVTKLSLIAWSLFESHASLESSTRKIQYTRITFRFVAVRRFVQVAIKRTKLKLQDSATCQHNRCNSDRDNYISWPSLRWWPRRRQVQNETTIADLWPVAHRAKLQAAAASVWSSSKSVSI
jgi:hypothetical protein